MANINGVNPPAINDVDYVDKITNSFNAVDGHDHTSGKGVPIGTAAIADDSISAAKIQTNAVTESKIVNLAITTNKIADVQVTNNKIANDTITNAKINSAAAIAYSKLNLTGSVNLASDVTGTLPVARGGTGSATQNFVDLTTAQTIAGNKKFSNAIISTDAVDSSFSTGTYDATGVTVNTFGFGSGTLEGITGAVNQFLVLVNKTGSDLVVANQSGSAAVGDKIYTGTGADVSWSDEAALFFLNADDSWHLVGGVGGSATYNVDFAGVSITASADAMQKYRYIGPPGVAIMTAIDSSAMLNGSRLMVTGSSNSNIITIPVGLTNVQINGECVLTQYSAIEFIKDGTQLIEVSRNGL